MRCLSPRKRLFRRARICLFGGSRKARPRRSRYVPACGAIPRSRPSKDSRRVEHRRRRQLKLNRDGQDVRIIDPSKRGGPGAPSPAPSGGAPVPLNSRCTSAVESECTSAVESECAGAGESGCNCARVEIRRYPCCSPTSAFAGRLRDGAFAPDYSGRHRRLWPLAGARVPEN